MDGNKSPEVKEKVPAFQINKIDSKVETLNGFQLVENGQRVYSAGNKPSLDELGAYSKSGGLLNGEVVMVGGKLGCFNRPDTLTMHGNSHTFITGISSAHFGYNAYYDGSWKKTNVNEPSGHLVISSSGLQMRTSPAGNSNAVVDTHSIYHTGNPQTLESLGAAPKAHNHNHTLSNDSRSITPSQTNIRSFTPYFTSNSNIGVSGGGYSDLLVMNTYGDSSGGLVNGIASSKKDKNLYHVQAPFNSLSWGEASKIYTEAAKPTPKDIGAADEGHTHTGYATTGHTHTGYATTGHTHSGYLTSADPTTTGVLTIGGLVMNTGFSTPSKLLLQGAGSTTYIGNPGVTGIYFETSNGVVYIRSGSVSHRVYHAGFKPTALDIQVTNPLTKDEGNLLDIIENLYSRIEGLELKLEEINNAT